MSDVKDNYFKWTVITVLVFLLFLFTAMIADCLITGYYKQQEQIQKADDVKVIIDYTLSQPAFAKMSAAEKEVFLTQELYQGYYYKQENGLDAAQAKAKEILKQ